ncbi:MAG TPA: hypothetical protein VFV66_36730 [Nonomuraea sp.]|nr:hypothetical protein [Nonomuraea sp.]
MTQACRISPLPSPTSTARRTAAGPGTPVAAAAAAPLRCSGIGTNL